MPAYDEAQAIAEDASAQRLLNLFFIFNTSTRPLTTDEIVSDTDLGYGSSQRESDVRKFRRDRAKLADQGIRIVEIKPSGASETEESSWRLDREHTFAAGGVITADDAQTLAQAIDEYLDSQPTPLARPLRSVRDKALDLVSIGASQDHARTDATADARSPLLDAIWYAFSARKKFTFAYTNARGGTSKRTVSIYGLFAHDGATYLTGLDDVSGEVRTFRADRIERAWRPKGSYHIPTDFDVREHVFLPFDFGDERYAAAFTFPVRTTRASARAITRGRGTLASKQDGPLTWTVDVHDTGAAASFALEHAREGLRPVAPVTLVNAWKHAIRRAVEAHGA